MREIRPLKPVSLREAWGDEARDFTPWLARNIDRLGAKLNLTLEQVREEVTLQGAGRVDIHAVQAETGATVVIENQLGDSDDLHCLRLLGYAATAKANILVWVARSFSPYHCSILEWLNEADTIHVYAVRIRTYRAGEALAADFQTVVEPPQMRPDAPARKTTNTLFAEFYRPLVARLRQKGVLTVGKGGWRGRWRSFQTGHSGAVYGTGLSGGKAKVFLSFRGAGHGERFRTLLRHRDEIDRKLKGAVSWHDESQGSWKSSVVLEGDGVADLTGPEDDLEAVRWWMADNLVSLRDALRTPLDEVMRAAADIPDEVDTAD